MIRVKKGWIMYECSHVEHTNAKCYSLYKEIKEGGCISVALYVDVANEEEAIKIFLDHIPLIPKTKKPNLGGTMIKPNYKYFNK